MNKSNKSIPSHRRNGKHSNEWNELAKLNHQHIHMNKQITDYCVGLSTSVKAIAQEHMANPLNGVTNEKLHVMIASATTVNQDVAKHAEEVKALGDAHGKKTGGVRNDNQVLEVLGYGDRYHVLTDTLIDTVSDNLGDVIVAVCEICDANPDRALDGHKTALEQAKASVQSVKKV